MQQLPKKNNTHLIIAVVVVAIMVIVFIGGAIGTSFITGTTQAQANWTTIQSFSGNGSKTTGTFDVPGDWKIVWRCDPASWGGLPYNVAVIVYNSDGTMADSGVNAMCSQNNIHDETEVHHGGTVYLSIISEGDWVIEVQEFK
jgi:hypothetical protein